MTTQLTATLARVDERLVEAVRIKLLTDNVTLIEHRPTGAGCQTVPVFAVPAHLLDRGRELGLTVVAR